MRLLAGSSLVLMQRLAAALDSSLKVTALHVLGVGCVHCVGLACYHCYSSHVDAILS
jgi:hypothetical protein